MKVLRYWKTLLTGAVTVSIVGGITYSTLAALGVDFGRGGAAHQEAQEQGKHLAANRDRLAICVQGSGLGDTGSVVEESAKASIELALIEFQKHPNWSNISASEPPPMVEIGCAADPGIYNQGPDVIDEYPPKTFFEVRGRRVSTPSYYRVMVFVLPKDEIARFVGDRPRLTNEESTCADDTCVQVTTGLYLAPVELSDTASLADELEKAVGLERPY